jgi:polysaccharide deacetylase 2 family uncharacterized protein YibQ
MASMTPKQKRSALITGALVYLAVSAALVGWLAFNGEDTVQDRISHTPSATISLVKKPDVPASWTGTTPNPPPAATMPEQKPLPSNPAPAVAVPEVKPPEAKPAEAKPAVTPPAPTPVPVAKTETPPAPAPQQPAVTTNPVDQAAPVNAAAAPAWHKFTRPFKPTDRPRIALIISDLGFAATATQAAVQEMPGDVTLAFSSQAPDIESWIAKARAAGHETILTVPMEPNDYPKNDPGPNTLLIALPDKDNISRINWAMARADGFVGVMPAMGEKFVTAENKLAPVLDVVKEHQLMMIDGTNNKNSLIASLSRLAHIPFARSEVLIDAAASRNAIDAQLASIEAMAKEKGQAVGIALPYPVTFEKLKAWIATLDQKGFVLAPISALASEDAPVAAVIAPPTTAQLAPPATVAAVAAPATPVAAIPPVTDHKYAATDAAAASAATAPGSGPIDIPIAKGPLTSINPPKPDTGP